MGIIVGRESYVECDNGKEGHRPQSPKTYDQSKVRELAERAGWWINPITGRALCPECRRQA